MKIYTKTGDKGDTSLAGGTRVKKNDLRLEAYGTIDELNSYLGMIRNLSRNKEDIELISFIQNKLFSIGAILATEEKLQKKETNKKIHITNGDILFLETSIDLFSVNLPVLKNFIIPTGNELISWCNISRTVCRRAERRIVAIESADVNYTNVLIFINRLSDLLFIMGRKYAKEFNVDEILWNNDL
ncbi:MAG: cob(I)yrinic acid a,c-diamide adenosyltransferase [Bacteroidales bacterium]|nr:cob(I)yrinic acid a,c-diamide adenosyltransferase [Bacteroidales bacterium]MDD3858733.1 cob(I)yrinic acid a,c-diamide adenosyltransferase [Bacteroidales bacterium]